VKRVGFFPLRSPRLLRVSDAPFKMSNHPAIRVDGISKCYRLGTQEQRHDTIVGALTGMLKAPFQNFRRLRDLADIPTDGPASNDVLWALRDVSFEMKEGEVVGIIGRNGAGKSTLLKILSQITDPTHGRADIYGRVASLLEVGTGFHSELTGRENLYLNGTILGMTKREIDNKFDAIVDFSGVEKFIDTAVKHYSSGMQVRLAFAVAAHLEPEILIIDEVLAVGDAAFQRKCMGKISQVAQQGRTILFVSHNMAAITRICGRALWFEQGRLRDSGETEQIVAKYLASDTSSAGEIDYRRIEGKKPGSAFIELEAIRILNKEGITTSSLDVRHPFAFEIQYRVLQRADNLRIAVRLNAHDGTVLFVSTDTDGVNELVREPGIYISRCEVPGDLLNHGQYYMTVGCDTPMVKTHFHVDPALTFNIELTGGAGGHISDGRGGVLRLRLPWKVEKVQS
jgi:lipopolysaccharide transport system ATP-binding protein